MTARRKLFDHIGLVEKLFSVKNELLTIRHLPDVIFVTFCNNYVAWNDYVIAKMTFIALLFWELKTIFDIEFNSLLM